MRSARRPTRARFNNLATLKKKPLRHKAEGVSCARKRKGRSARGKRVLRDRGMHETPSTHGDGGLESGVRAGPFYTLILVGHGLVKQLFDVFSGGWRDFCHDNRHDKAHQEARQKLVEARRSREEGQP